MTYTVLHQNIISNIWIFFPPICTISCSHFVTSVLGKKNKQTNCTVGGWTVTRRTTQTTETAKIGGGGACSGLYGTKPNHHYITTFLQILCHQIIWSCYATFSFLTAAPTFSDENETNFSLLTNLAGKHAILSYLTDPVTHLTFDFASAASQTVAPMNSPELQTDPQVALDIQSELIFGNGMVHLPQEWNFGTLTGFPSPHTSPCPVTITPHSDSTKRYFLYVTSHVQYKIIAMWIEHPTRLIIHV